MKTFAERVFVQLPAYLPDLVALVGQPKRTIGARSGEEAGDLARALAFVGITVGIGFILQGPAIGPQGDFLALAASMAAFKLVAILLFAGVVWGAFHLVGGRGSFLRTLIAYTYLVSPVYLALVVLSLVGTGFVRAYDPALAQRLRVEPLLFRQEPQLLDAFEAASPALAAGYAATGILGLAVLLGWFLACLGAFRSLHGVSRWRSGIAGSMIGAAYWPFAGLVAFLSLGIFGSLAPPLQ